MPESEWELFFFKLFDLQYRFLVDEVKALRKKKPEGYIRHPKTKMLKKMRNAIFKDVPTDPLHSKFNLGNMLGPNFRQFKRVKNDMPDRYRLFFRFSSEGTSIIYIWMNDRSSLRQEGSKRDVYSVFRHMIEKGDVPEEYSGLLDSSHSCEHPVN